MRPPLSPFVDARALGRVRNLALAARRVVDGYLAGHHRSPRSGGGVEFDQFRSYGPGDDLRRVDWRVYARSDRFFVRESEVERDIVVRFVLDATASMSVADGEGTKLDAARGLVATLAVLADRQGDRVALHTVGEGRGAGTLEGGRGPGPLIHRLERLEARGRWPARGLAELGFPLTRRRALVVVVTDGFQEGDEIERDLERLVTAGHDVLLFHLLTRDEIEFPWREDRVFRDLETGETVAAAGTDVRRVYLAARDAALAEWRRFTAARDVEYRLTPTDEPLDEVLSTTLLRRREAR